MRKNKKISRKLLMVTYNFDGQTYTEEMTSGALASVLCDPYVEIIDVREAQK